MTTLTERKLILRELHTLAVEDITDLWRDASPLPSSAFRSVMVDAMPQITDPYAATAAEFTAEWYDEALPGTRYKAVPGELPIEKQVISSSEWAMGASGDKALARLSEVAQRTIFGSSRATTLWNVKYERGAGWARVASPGACAFCAMMVSRGAVYSVDTVDFRAHANCGCMAIEVRPGRTYEPGETTLRFADAYDEAAERAEGTKDILAEMRQILGSH